MHEHNRFRFRANLLASAWHKENRTPRTMTIHRWNIAGDHLFGLSCCCVCVNVCFSCIAFVMWVNWIQPVNGLVDTMALLRNKHNQVAQYPEICWRCRNSHPQIIIISNENKRVGRTECIASNEILFVWGRVFRIQNIKWTHHVMPIQTHTCLYRYKIL